MINKEYWLEHSFKDSMEKRIQNQKSTEKFLGTTQYEELSIKAWSTRQHHSIVHEALFLGSYS